MSRSSLPFIPPLTLGMLKSSETLNPLESEENPHEISDSNWTKLEVKKFFNSIMEKFKLVVLGRIAHARRLHQWLQ